MLRRLFSTQWPSKRTSRNVWVICEQPLNFAAMENLVQEIEKLKSEINSFNSEEQDAAEAFRIKYLGSHGLVKALMGRMREVAPEQRRETGQAMNALKLFAEEAHNQLKQQAVPQASASGDEQDYSLPGEDFPLGSRHPISLVRNRIVSIFSHIGFAVAEGPEVEDD